MYIAPVAMLLLGLMVFCLGVAVGRAAEANARDRRRRD